MRKDKGNYRNKLNKKELIKWKKRKKEENINVKKEQKQAQKDIKRKYKKEIKNKKVKPEEKISNMSRKKRMKNEIIIVWLALITLLARIGWIQFGMGSELQSKAYVQQTLDRSINPRRGTIYDSTGTNILAVSSTVETVTVNPVNIKKEDKEKVAKALSNIFELDYEKVYKKVNKRSSIETIIKKIDKEKSNELRVWLQENNITAGVNIDEDTKRYYPYNNLASQIIGFSGSDNQGLDGIEAVYDEQLKGTKGKIQKITDATGGEIEKESENYVKAIDGNDLILTIDATIQGIAEKYLKEACIENKCTDGGNIVVMNPKTGDVLAIAGYPNYNLNEPFEPSTEELKQQWPNMSQAERNKTMLSLWRNKAVTDTYEPGSVFKLITALGIRHVGAKSAKSLAKIYKSLDNLMNATLEDLSNQNDVGKITAKSIYEFFRQEQTIDLINKLKVAGVNTILLEEETSDNRFEGKTFVLTGTLEKYTRDEASDIIEKFGGKTSSSVSKKTSYVLAGQEAGSKLIKAQNLGVEIITEQQFEEMVKE